jgi:hypothetical protein
MIYLFFCTNLAYRDFLVYPKRMQKKVTAEVKCDLCAHKFKDAFDFRTVIYVVHCLCYRLSYRAVLQIRITLIRIRILLVTLMQIRIRILLVTLMRIRILLFTLMRIWICNTAKEYRYLARLILACR